MAAEPDLILASASPRRRELLERVGLIPWVIPADVDETPQPAEKALAYARRVAAAKCDAIAEGRSGSGGASAPAGTDATSTIAASSATSSARPLAVVAADTTVVIDDQILGKPEDEGAARAMLSQLAGRRHEVITAYRVRHLGRTAERAVTTTVFVRSVQPAEVDAYIASGEWRGKAGGYAVQGIAAAFVTELRGSVTNVIGLPLAELLADLQALGALPGYPRPGFGVP